MSRLSKARWLVASLATLGMVPSAVAQAGKTAPAPAVQSRTPPVVARRPNFLVIVADDLGFSDIGAFGGEIQTPNLDRLALSGVRLTGYHTSSMCAPTRAQLLTGVDSHLAGLGRMDAKPSALYDGHPGYEGYLRADVATLPEILRDNGYRTVQAGKWHLGQAPANDPSQRGFDYSYVMIQGAQHHFGADLSASGKGGTTYRENGKVLTSLPTNYYSSDAFASKLIDGLRSTRARDGSKPFFAYLAFSAPHWPLHAPPEVIAKYRGRYADGYEALRTRRIERQDALGLASAKLPRAYSDEVRPWAQLSNEDKAYYIASQEVYAAMVDRLDINVGRVVDYLKSTGEYENTVVLFHSDNGAAGRDLLRDRTPMAKFKQADNTPANIGKPTSFAAVGSGWAEAASAPAKLYKRYQTEGGTRVVAFLRYDGLAKTGGAAAGSIDGVYTNVRDITPTFLDLAGIPVPQGSYKGRVVQPISGRSELAYWQGRAGRVYPADVPVGGELYGSKSLRKGDWKLVSLRGDDWALYNVARDPGETKDLSATEPAKLAELRGDWTTYARTNRVLEDPQINSEELAGTNPQ
jgi:arylsulfatase A-like enzyme